MPFEWWMDHLALLVIMWLIGKMMMASAQKFVMWTYWYISEQIKAGNMPGGKPTLKAAAGMTAVALVPTVVELIKGWLTGMGKGAQPPNV